MQTTNDATIVRDYQMLEVTVDSLIKQLNSISEQYDNINNEQAQDLKQMLTAINDESEHIVNVKSQTSWSIVKIKLEHTYSSESNFGSTIVIHSKLTDYDPNEQLNLPTNLVELTFPFTAYDPPEFPSNISNMFANCENVKKITLLALSSHYSDRYNISRLFYNCRSLKHINIALLKSLNIISAVDAFQLITTELTTANDITIIAYGAVINTLTADETSRLVNPYNYVFDDDITYTLTCRSTLEYGTEIMSYV